MGRILLIIILLIGGAAASSAQARRPRAASARKSVEEMLVSNERRSWEAAKTKDYKTFESFLAEDFRDVFPNGQALTKPELMSYIRGVDLADYTLSSFRVVMLNRDAAIVVYEAVAHGTEHTRASRDTE
jgi:Domain of unknown function (DUF4440)